MIEIRNAGVLFDKMFQVFVKGNPKGLSWGGWGLGTHNSMKQLLVPFFLLQLVKIELVIRCARSDIIEIFWVDFTSMMDIYMYVPIGIRQKFHVSVIHV